MGEGGRKSPRGAKIFPGGQLPPYSTFRAYGLDMLLWNKNMFRGRL